MLLSNRKNYRYELIWEKSCPTGFLDANRRPLRAHENILVFARKPNSTTYNPQKVEGKAYKTVRKGSNTVIYGDFGKSTTLNQGDRHPRSVLKFASERACGGKSHHPTAKPLSLMRWLVATYSNPGDLVLDPFAGSGSTLVACSELDRRAIGVEFDPGYYQTALGRLAQGQQAALPLRMRAA